MVMYVNVYLSTSTHSRCVGRLSSGRDIERERETEREREKEKEGEREKEKEGEKTIAFACERKRGKEGECVLC